MRSVKATLLQRYKIWCKQNEHWWLLRACMEMNDFLITSNYTNCMWWRILCVIAGTLGPHIAKVLYPPCELPAITLHWKPNLRCSVMNVTQSFILLNFFWRCRDLTPVHGTYFDTVVICCLFLVLNFYTHRYDTVVICCKVSFSLILIIIFFSRIHQLLLHARPALLVPRPCLINMNSILFSRNFVWPTTFCRNARTLGTHLATCQHSAIKWCARSCALLMFGSIILHKHWRLIYYLTSDH